MITRAAKSSGLAEAKVPPNFPTAVLVISTIYTSFMTQRSQNTLIAKKEIYLHLLCGEKNAENTVDLGVDVIDASPII